MIKLAQPDSTYTLIDVPDSLVFAFTHLKPAFPDAEFLLIDSPGNLEGEWWRGYDFILCPIQYFGEVSFPDQVWG